MANRKLKGPPFLSGGGENPIVRDMLAAEDDRAARNRRLREVAGRAIDAFFVEAATALGSIIPGAPSRALIREVAKGATPILPPGTELELPGDIMTGEA